MESDRLHLRRIECSHHMSGNVGAFRRTYNVSLAIDDGNGFEEFLSMEFKRYETAIAFCLGRMVGDFKRGMDESYPVTDVDEETMMWKFVLEEYLSENTYCSSTEVRCRSSIMVRKSLGEEFSRYRNIGHMGVLGISHIVETISSDNHLGESTKGDISMFTVKDGLYAVRRFSNDYPCVSGINIVGGGNIDVNYHLELVTFHHFGTVVKWKNMYFLDGEVVYVDTGGVDQREILAIISQSYPNAKRYESGMEFGSMDSIGKTGGKNDN